MRLETSAGAGEQRPRCQAGELALHPVVMGPKGTVSRGVTRSSLLRRSAGRAAPSLVITIVYSFNTHLSAYYVPDTGTEDVLDTEVVDKKHIS